MKIFIYVAVYTICGLITGTVFRYILCDKKNDDDELATGIVSLIWPVVVFLFIIWFICHWSFKLIGLIFDFIFCKIPCQIGDNLKEKKQAEENRRNMMNEYSKMLGDEDDI